MWAKLRFPHQNFIIHGWKLSIYFVFFYFLSFHLLLYRHHRKMCYMKSEWERNFFHSLLVYFSPWTFFFSFSSFSLAVWVLRVFAYKKYTQLRKGKKISEFRSHFEGKSFHLRQNAGYIILNLFHAELIDVCFLNLHSSASHVLFQNTFICHFLSLIPQHNNICFCRAIFRNDTV